MSIPLQPQASRHGSMTNVHTPHEWWHGYFHWLRRRRHSHRLNPLATAPRKNQAISRTNSYKGLFSMLKGRMTSANENTETKAWNQKKGMCNSKTYDFGCEIGWLRCFGKKNKFKCSGQILLAFRVCFFSKKLPLSGVTSAPPSQSSSSNFPLKSLQFLATQVARVNT